MTQKEKKRKAAMIAVAYYLEQEKLEAQANLSKDAGSWSKVGKEMIMSKRMLVQRRGRLLRSA